MLEHIEEYLVGIGADIDKQSFNSAQNALRQLEGGLRKLKYAAAPAALIGFFTAVAKAAVDTIRSVAKADMEYQKLAKDMWVTKDSAKALKIAMDAMGASVDDIAWIPELREQFFRLRKEMQQFSTPVDADRQLRYIREIGYDIQALFVRLKMFKEWLAYHLIKYLKPYIDEFKKFIKYLSDMLGADMPEKARKLAKAISMILSVAIQTVRAFGLAIRKVYEFVGSLPDNVKKWAAVFAAVGAIIMAGPFGRLLAALSVAMLLIEDFMFYLNGWNSSRTMAPVWKSLIDFANGTGGSWLESFKTTLGEIADILDRIFKGINLNKCLEEAGKSFKSLGQGVENLWKHLKKMFKEMDDGKPKIKDFWTEFGNAIGTVIRGLFRLIGALGGVMDSVSSYLDGDRKEGLKKMRRAWGTLTGEGTASQFEGVGKDAIERSQAMVANPTSDLLGNPNGCTYFVQNAVGSNDEFISSMKGDLYVPHWVSKAREQGRYNPGTDGMKAGDIVVVSYGKPGGFGDHVVVYDGKGGYYGNSTSKGKPVHGNLQEDFGDAVAGYIRPGKNKYDVDLSVKPKQETLKPNSDVTGAIASGMLKDIKLSTPGTSGFVSGDQEMVMGPLLESYGGQVFQNRRGGRPAYFPGPYGTSQSSTSNSYGGLNIGAITINVPGTNAKPRDIANAVTDNLDHYWQALKMHQGRGVLG